MLAARGMEPEEQDTLVAALATDRERADLAPADRVMLEYVVKLTRTPGDIVGADVDALRAQGFDDRGIHDICAIAAYYAFVNRTADGLGVELEPDRGPTHPGRAAGDAADDDAEGDG